MGKEKFQTTNQLSYSLAKLMHSSLNSMVREDRSIYSMTEWARVDEPTKIAGGAHLVHSSCSPGLVLNPEAAMAPSQ